MTLLSFNTMCGMRDVKSMHLGMDRNSSTLSAMVDAAVPTLPMSSAPSLAMPKLVTDEG